MNIEVNEANVTVDGNNLVIKLTEELRKSLGLTCTKPLYECKVGNVIVELLKSRMY